MTQPLAEIREGFYADLLALPFHRHLGVAVKEVPPPGLPRITLPPGPDSVGQDGQHSAAAVYTLGDIASAAEMWNEVAPRAMELEMSAIFLTVSASFELSGPARGTIEAITNLVSGLDDAAGETKTVKKATIDVEARIVGEDGELVGEHRTSFYVRFMEESRLRAMTPAASGIVRLIGP